MSVTILPNAKTQFFSAAGVPLAGGSVFMYVPNSSTFKTTWQDSGATIPNTNPIILDAGGECLLWGNGSYRQVVYDSLGNLIWDQITEDPGFAVAASFGGTSTTSIAIGTGTKTFTTQPGLQFFPGATVNIASNASALNYMNGTVASYNTSTGVLVVTVLTDGGSGTYADWNIAVSGVQGPAGTVTAISVATANGLAGSSSGGGTPQLTLTTSVTGVVKGNGTALSAATAGTDYSAGTSALATGILKSTTTTGALSIAVAGDFPTLNQNTTGQAGTVVTNANLTGPITSVGNATTITNSSVTEAKLSLSNNTTANVTTSAHGFAPILPNNISLFLNGVGTYTAPVAGSTIGTSTTSLTIGTGSKTYTMQSGLTIAAGQYLIIPSNANSANYMFGQVTSYTGTTLVMNITVTGGSGTFADWNILSSGPQGPTGGLTTTGTPASGNLTKFSGSSTITNADLTGDVTTSGTVATTLATVNSNVGTFAITTINGKGLVTAAANMTGDVTTSLGVSTLATVNTNVGSFTSANITVDGKGRITAASSGTAGNFVLLSSQTITSSTASVSVTTGINSTYSHYVWEISNLVPVTNNVDAYITVQQGGTFIGGTSYSAQYLRVASNAVNGIEETGTAQFDSTGGEGALRANGPSIIRFEFWNPAAALPLSAIFESTQYGVGNGPLYVRGAASLSTSAATTGIKLALSSGNIATCQANLYGIT